MLSGVNNNQPSFQGMYILKGKAKTVDRVSQLISERCFDEIRVIHNRIRNQLTGEQIPEYVREFTDYNTLNLVPIYSENQPMVHKLIATNEHVPNICNWYEIMNPYEKDQLLVKIEEVRVIQTPNGTRVEGDIGGIIKGLQAKIQKIQQKMAPYLEAERAAQNGNMDKLSDFLIDSMQQIKQRLQEVRDLATVPYDEPKVLKAKEVINAIKENRFDFVTGEIH